MAPFLVTALIGVGVKIATDLFTSGVKKIVAPNSTGGGTFSALLDRARGVAPAGKTAPADATPAAPRLAGLDQAQVRMVDAGGAVPTASRAYGAASYHRLDVEAP
jgi:hypothetical protein